MKPDIPRLEGQALLDFIKENREKLTERELAIRSGWCSHSPTRGYKPHVAQMLRATLHAQGLQTTGDHSPAKKGIKRHSAVGGPHPVHSKGFLHLGPRYMDLLGVGPGAMVDMQFIRAGEEMVVTGPAWVALGPDPDPEPEADEQGQGPLPVHPTTPVVVTPFPASNGCNLLARSAA